MKPSLLVLALLALVSPSFLQAQDSPDGADFDAMDTNGDGAVSEKEFLTYHLAELKRGFEALDQNGNQSLEKTELGAPVVTEAGPRFTIPRIIRVRPDPSIHRAKVTAGSRGPAGPLSRRINR